MSAAASEGNDPQAEREERLITAVDKLHEEVRVLRQAIDELRDVIEYVTRNPDPGERRMTPHRRITSMPLDPTAADFAQRINKFTPADLPDEHPSEIVRDAEATSPAGCDIGRSANQGRLFWR